MVELTRRYVVMALAADAPFDLTDHDAPFVLKPWKDPAALRALQAYRDNCYPELRHDLDEWIRVIVAGPVVRGGVGGRNEPFVRAGAARKAAAGRGPARAMRERPAKGGRRATTRRARTRTGKAKKRAR
jgi:hypothetical protein